VRCAPLGSVAVGSVLWTHRGELYVTAVIKASFSFPNEGTMRRLNPQPLRRTDDYLSGVPSLSGASEIAPQSLSPEVIVVGHAYPERAETRKRSVRLTVVRGHRIIIDKTLFVYGDRVRGGRPKSFNRMRIGYERALGGLTFPENPIGIGRDDDSSRLPNVIDPRNPEMGVAGFGPFPARFPKRRRFIKHLPPGALDQVPIDFPDDFDWRFFNAAPKDQHLDRLRGDEWLMVEGMHPMYPRLRARLPRLQARCRVYAPPGVHAPDLVAMRADLLHVEPGEQRCSLVWRGHFPVRDASVAEALVLVGAVQTGEETIAWPATVAELDPGLPALTPAGRGGGHLEGTQASAGPPPSGRRIPSEPGWMVAVEGEEETRVPPPLNDTVQPPPLSLLAPPTKVPPPPTTPDIEAAPSWPVAAGWATPPSSEDAPARPATPPPPHPPTVKPRTTPQGTPDFAQTVVYGSPQPSPGTQPVGTVEAATPRTVEPPYDFHATRFEHTEIIVDDEELEVLSDDEDDLTKTHELD